RGERKGNEPGKPLDRGALRGSQVLRRPCREHEEFALIAVQLNRVPGKIRDLVSIQRNDGFTGRFEPAPEHIPRRQVLDRVDPGQGKVRSDTKHYIGVINRSPVVANAFKSDRLKIEIGAEFLERFAVGSPGKGDI